MGKALTMSLAIDVSSLAGLIWVTLDGQLDVATAPRLHRELRQLPLDRTEVRLDVTALEFIDSTGLGVLLGLAERAEQHGRVITLVDPTPAVARLMRLVDVTRRFRIVDAPRPVASES